MKKIIVTILILVSASIGYSQSDCDLEVKKDDFAGTSVITKNRRIAYEAEIFGKKDTWSLWMRLLYKNGSTYLVVNHQASKSTNNAAIVFFKLVDGTILKYTKHISGQEHFLKGEGTGVSTFFTLTKSDIEKLASADIEKFRVDFENNMYNPHVEKELKDRKSDDFKNDAICFLKEISNLPLAAGESNNSTLTDSTELFSKIKASEPIPPTLIRKWIVDRSSENLGKSLTETSIEFSAKNDVHEHTYKNENLNGKFFISDNGKYLTLMYNNQKEVKLEIITLNEKVLILKLPNGKLVLCNA